MEAPKVRSPFRNIRTEPRRFTFKSPLYDPKKMKIEERLSQLEAEASGELADVYTHRRKIDFKRRRALQTHESKGRILRFVAILIGLLIGLYYGLEWADKTDFMKSLNLFKNV